MITFYPRYNIPMQYASRQVSGSQCTQGNSVADLQATSLLRRHFVKAGGLKMGKVEVGMLRLNIDDPLHTLSPIHTSHIRYTIGTYT